VRVRAPSLAARLAAAEHDDDGPWSALERLGRALLGSLASNPELAADPLWRLLAMLDGRPADAPAEPGSSDRAAASEAADWIAIAAWGRGGAPEGSAPSDLLRMPARVFATSVHLDVVFAADGVSLPARRAGLDLDPGWQPRFGRAVAFHYRD
jgi:hypothetical protein